MKFADSIIQMASNKKIRHQYAIKARKRVKDLYDIQNIGKNITKIYEETIQSFKREHVNSHE